MSSEQKPRKITTRLERKFGFSEEERPRRRTPRVSAGEDSKNTGNKFGSQRGRAEHASRDARQPAETSPEIDQSPSVRAEDERKPRPPRFSRDERPRVAAKPDSPPPWKRRQRGGYAMSAEQDVAKDAILDRDPPWIKRILALSTDKGREREGAFIAEGARCVLEMLLYHTELITGVYVAAGFAHPQVHEAAQIRGIRIQEITPEQMARISTTTTSPGILAVCRSASVKPDYELARTLTLVDAIQDPGNLGAIFRTSLGFSMGGVLLGKGTVNPFNPKVVRGSSGTFLRVPFEQEVDLLERIQFLRHKGFTVIATDLHAKQSLEDIAPRRLRKVALLVGNEGAGADEKHLQHADELVRIPMNQTLESLNVAVAHGILTYQIEQIRKTL